MEGLVHSVGSKMMIPLVMLRQRPPPPPPCRLFRHSFLLPHAGALLQIDMDTIETSNLNRQVDHGLATHPVALAPSVSPALSLIQRCGCPILAPQFLFRKRHVGQSKSLVAAEAVKGMAADVEITAHQVWAGCAVWWQVGRCTMTGDVPASERGIRKQQGNRLPTACCHFVCHLYSLALLIRRLPFGVPVQAGQREGGSVWSGLLPPL